MGFSQMAMFVSFFSGWAVPKLARTYDLGTTFAIGASLCSFSLILAIVLAKLDDASTIHDKKLMKKRKNALE